MSRDKTIEEEFIRAFVIKERRERTLFELASKKKRNDFLSKLCHNFDKILDERFMTAVQVPAFDEAHTYSSNRTVPQATAMLCLMVILTDKILLLV